MTAIPVLIDCDPGQDDAVMLMLAMNSPELEVLGITAVGGNVPLARTEANARRIRDLMGRPDIPVHAGCDRPLVRPLVTAEHVHGETGLRGLDLPEPAGPLAAGHGVDFIVETLRARDDVVLCPTGPLTNIAMALVKAPDIAGRVRRIVLMGGAVAGGNVTPVAEYNIHADPEAADVVFRCGAPITMIGLDCTHRALVGPRELARLRASQASAARAAFALFDHPAAWDPPRFGGRQGLPVHDACVIGYLLAPGNFAGRECHVAIETSSRLTLGQTVVDWHGGHGNAPNAMVIGDVHASAFLDDLVERLSR
ncbi:MAG: nucleoside hydrolase [Alphaproteobacteria bacterium]